MARSEHLVHVDGLGAQAQHGDALAACGHARVVAQVHKVVCELQRVRHPPVSRPHLSNPIAHCGSSRTSGSSRNCGSSRTGSSRTSRSRMTGSAATSRVCQSLCWHSARRASKLPVIAPGGGALADVVQLTRKTVVVATSGSAAGPPPAVLPRPLVGGVWEATTRNVSLCSAWRGRHTRRQRASCTWTEALCMTPAVHAVPARHQLAIGGAASGSAEEPVRTRQKSLHSTCGAATRLRRHSSSKWSPSAVADSSSCTFGSRSHGVSHLALTRQASPGMTLGVLLSVRPNGPCTSSLS